MKMKIYECAMYSQLIPSIALKTRNYKNENVKIATTRQRPERKYRSVKNFIFMSTDEMLTISHCITYTQFFFSSLFFLLFREPLLLLLLLLISFQSTSKAFK